MKFLISIPILMVAIYSASSFSDQGRLDVSLRQHGKDKNLIEKPALIQYTDSKEKKTSYLIDAALKATFAPENSTIEISGTIESHKNTLIDKEQDTITVGLTTGKYLKFWGAIPTQGLSNITLHKNNIFGDASINYQVDNVKDKESILTVFELSGTVTDIYINHVCGLCNFPIYWAPIIGVEHENFIKAANDETGSLGRLYGNLEIGLYPFANNLDERLALTISHSYWKDFDKEDALGIEKDEHGLSKTSASYKLTPHESDVTVSLVLSWLDGEDPRNKKPEQRYTEFGIGVLF